jgi:hypothetical protein
VTHRKVSLPTKPCRFCLREFSWRKKWWRCWTEVQYCSERCKRQARLLKRNACAAGQAEAEF